jgi:hypothetical protein
MPIHIDWDRADPSAVFHAFYAPLTGLAVALALALAARFMRAGWLAAAAGGAGVVGGWYALGGRLWVTYSRPSVDHLAFAAAAALVIALLCERFGRSRGALFALLLTAAFLAWWLCGTPRTRPDLLEDWPIALGAAAAVVLYARSLAADAVDPLRLALTGATMAASFHVVMLPAIWLQLALVPALASLALFALPAASGLAALPIAADIAAVGSLAVIDFGRLPRLRMGAVDVAAIAPLLALWLAPHLAGRLRFTGRAAGAGAGVLAALLATGAAWVAFRTLGR